jgi:osmotically-inducible protein OsmY
MKRSIKSKKNTPAPQPAIDDKVFDAAVLNAIDRITTIPREALTVTTYEGWVRLEGTLPNWNQKETVDNVVRHTPGVKGLISLIRVESQSSNPPNRGVTL